MSTQAQIVAWTCFVVGTTLLLVGVVIGFYVTFKSTREHVKAKVDEAKQKIEELKTTALSAARADSASEPAAAAAASTAEAAKGPSSSCRESSPLSRWPRASRLCSSSSARR
jgi:cell division septum initiation protein DivIVA